MTLALRAAGAFGAVIALLELVLGVIGSRELSGAYWIWKKASARVDLWSAQLDLTGWVLLGVGCVLLVFFARRAEAWLTDRPAAADPQRARLILGRVTLGLAATHAFVWSMGWAWPHRFSASMVLLLAARVARRRRRCAGARAPARGIRSAPRDARPRPVERCRAPPGRATPGGRRGPVRAWSGREPGS